MNFINERLTNKNLIRYLLLFALGWAIAQMLSYFSTIIIIFIFAGILAFLLNYPVQWVSRFLPRSVAIILVFLLSLIIIGGLIITVGLTVILQTETLLNQAPQFINSVIFWLEDMQNILSNWNIDVNFEAVEQQLREQAAIVIKIGLTTIQGLLLNLIDLIVIAVVTFFMLSDGKRVWDFIMKAFPENIRPNITEAIKRNFLGFFWGRLLLSIFFGISTYIVFNILQLPYALTLAAMAAMFDLIPGIGATIGISLVCLIILPQGIGLSLKVLIGCILLQQVQENILMPRIMQGSININPVFMFFALLVGAKIAGLVGLFLAIPVAGVLISLFEIKEMQGEH